jgi:hypothetical protein
VLAKMPVLMANLRRLYPSRTVVTQDHISTRMRENFMDYDSLYSALQHRHRMIQIRCLDRVRYRPYDEWTTFFWEKWGALNQEVTLYRDQLDSASMSRIFRHHMQNALFEFLVFLFLTGEQIEKLKEVVSNDLDVQIALDGMCEANKLLSVVLTKSASALMTHTSRTLKS